MATKRYTSTKDLQNFWLSDIAPKYFDFDNVNLYRAGIFGYINEVMSTSIMDTHNAINIARREVYPVSAQYPQSFYKMAACQKINLPFATPANCNATLIFDRDEIINNSTVTNGVYKCIIDNECEIQASNLNFVLLYPIIILSKKSNGVWVHTIHYDKSIPNSMDDCISNYYLANTIAKRNGKDYLLVSTQLKQCKMEPFNEPITGDNSLETKKVIFQFSGDLAGFECFYYENDEASNPLHLEKVLVGATAPNTPYCNYRLLSNNMIEISFEKNSIFNPEINSVIQLQIYTTEGDKGNQEQFPGELDCKGKSDRYPYNNDMFISGIINGKIHGGKAFPSLAEFSKIVKDSYTTNNTISTTNDLQVKFNSLIDDDNIKILPKKRRDDLVYREYGSYLLLKDLNGNVVPTNTLSINVTKEDFDIFNEETQYGYIKPGHIFRYDPDSFEDEIYTGKIDHDIAIQDDLSVYDANDSFDFIYTTPFLIRACLDPNVIGYYYNSINKTCEFEYNYINDSSQNQFLVNNMMIYRNALDNENFYTFSLNVMPSSTIDPTELVMIPEVTDSDYYIRAKQGGYIESILYENNVVVATLHYDDDTTEQIEISSSVETDRNGNSKYTTGYDITLSVYDTFVKDDIIGTKKVTDLGKFRACIDFSGILKINGLYIPMLIEYYDPNSNIYTLKGYLATTDEIGDNKTLYNGGIYTKDGSRRQNASFAYENITLSISTFIKNDDVNYAHSYDTFSYFKGYTMTNTYTTTEASKINLIERIDLIRSNVLFSEPKDDSEDFGILIREIPLVKANWIKSTENFKYFYDKITECHVQITDTIKHLDNDYRIDMKFYNSYGKSKYFRAGIGDTWKDANRTSCKFSFGVCLSDTASESTFLSQFKAYVKDAVESINNDTSQTIYIMNLIHDIKENFSELNYLEYYGFNEYSYDIQKIEPIPSSELTETQLQNYVPEFLNISTVRTENGNEPDINVVFLAKNHM